MPAPKRVTELQAQAGALTESERLAGTDLPTLAAEIVREHEAASSAARSALGHARRAGELLIEARRQVGHGGWTAWLKDNFPASDRTARLYMQVARGWSELEASGNGNALPIREAARLLAEPKRDLLADAERDELEELEDLIRRKLPHITFPLDKITVGRSGKWSAFIEPSDVDGFFYVTTLENHPDQSATVEGSIRPIRAPWAAFDLVVAHEGCFPLEGATWDTIPFPAAKRLSWNRWLYSSHEDYVQRHVLGRAS